MIIRNLWLLYIQRHTALCLTIVPSDKLINTDLAVGTQCTIKEGKQHYTRQLAAIGKFAKIK